MPSAVVPIRVMAWPGQLPPVKLLLLFHTQVVTLLTLVLVSRNTLMSSSSQLGSYTSMGTTGEVPLPSPSLLDSSSSVPS